MAVTERGRAVTFAILCTLPALFGQEYVIPDVSIEPLKPRGIRITIPDTGNMILFVFQGRVNRQIGDNDVGDITAEVTAPVGGLWTYKDDRVQLKVGDIIYYYVHVIKDRKGYHKSNLTYRVRDLFDSGQPSRPASQPSRPASQPSRPASQPSSPAVQPSTSSTPTRLPDPITLDIPVYTAPNFECRPTVTSVLSSGSSQSVCSGHVIFEDDFNELREDKWTIEQFIPSKPEYPFVSYQRTSVSVENGILRIQPQLQENLPGFDSDAITYSTLDLSLGCTRAGSCVFSSDGGHILPPIAAGRVTSKSFSFKYGTIEVRARVPQGDWLYPDILLESLLKKYGADNYASGVMRIAGVLGNIILTKGSEDYGNKVLYGGPMMDFKCRENLLVKKHSGTEWGNDFHVYSLRWAPEMITLFVDGEEWGRIVPPTSGLQTRLPRDKCVLPRTFLVHPLAPFNDYFSIILGVSAGGVSEFPDGVVSLYTTPKPWINTKLRARLNFFMAKNSWLPTWTQPALLVDYIKVRAL